MYISFFLSPQFFLSCVGLTTNFLRDFWTQLTANAHPLSSYIHSYYWRSRGTSCGPSVERIPSRITFSLNRFSFGKTIWKPFFFRQPFRAAVMAFRIEYLKQWAPLCELSIDVFLERKRYTHLIGLWIVTTPLSKLIGFQTNKKRSNSDRKFR